MIFTNRFATPLGFVRIACAQDALIGLWFDGQRYAEVTMPKNMTEDARNPVLIHTRKWLENYFDGARPSLHDITISPRGTPFQRQIWQLLCAIPYGETTTYGILAAKAAQTMNKPSMSAQAVGNAVGHNPISIVIPCHRVIGVHGSLTGYAGGLLRKQWLLRHEGAFNRVP